MDNLPYSSSEIHAGVLEDDPLICDCVYLHLRKMQANFMTKEEHQNEHYWEGFNEGFLVLCYKIKKGEYEERGKILHYAMVVIKNNIRNHLRKMRTKIDFPGEMPNMKSLEITPEELALYADKEDEIANAFEIAGTFKLYDWFSKLPFQKRQIIELTHEGKKAREVGEELSISTSNVTTSLQRLRKKMKSLLKEF